MGLLLGLVIVSLLGYCQTDEKVSFYGASYIHLPVQEAKGTTDISFRFRTRLSDAILLLAAGKTDYCLIKLEAGRLKVHINLGAGESEMASPKGLTLNDLSWHKVNLTRREANITLQIDVIHTTEFVLPGRFFELNIHYGVFIGGRGDFNELFLGHIEYFRGCMGDIIYNGARVIQHTRLRKGQSEATSVTWSCSPEFDATRKTEMSFVEDGAFTAIAETISRSGSKWELELKTAAESGLLFYNADQSSYSDYLGIELFEGKIRVLMNKGNGPTELIHGTMVADGKWHRIAIEFSPSIIGIIIDGNEKTKALPSGGNRYLDLADTLYIGGAELNKRARALAKGLKSGDISYKGCLRNMYLNNRELGLPDVKISQGIVVGCVWSFPCADAEPCVHGASCFQLGVMSFECTCDQKRCIKPSYAEENKIYLSANLPVNLEILALSPLVVAEGKHTLVTSENIAMVLDIAKYGVEESGVNFTLVTPPNHGTLALDLLTSTADRSFTLQDINHDKIKYRHDGSETTQDTMILDVKLHAGTGYTLPNYLQGRLRFPLNVNVTSVNDPPALRIPSAKVLRLAQGTRKALSSDLIWADDPDTASESLVYTALRSDGDSGHIERVSHPSQRIDTFTQSELSQGLIVYVHRGNAKPNSLLGFTVSDGMASSEPAYLRVSAYPLQIKLQHNTGLVVVHRSYTYLTPGNLSFVTNSDDPSIELKYDLVSPPQYGALQLLDEHSANWQTVERFSSRDVEAHLVRYLHTQGSPSQDEFKFQASVRQVKTQQVYDFRITFIDLELRELRRHPITFSNSSETLINGQALKYQTNPLVISPSKISFAVSRVARFGQLLLSNRVLDLEDTFTQEDVDFNRVKYKLLRRSYSPIEDSIEVRVTAPQCSAIVASVPVRYQLNNGHDITSVETLRAIEGSKVALKISGINFEDYGVTHLSFNVTEELRHGWLTVGARVNATGFTLHELQSQSVFYVHDDSETVEDGFEFLALSMDSADFMYVGTFRIVIELKNDNPPTRVDQKVFNVVVKGDKLITSAELNYTDKDLDTKPSDIKYKKLSMDNGYVCLVTNPSVPINEFTQEDINNKRILFRHSGHNRGSLQFDVSDGLLSVTGTLQIHASSPYVRLKLAHKSIVQFNRTLTLTSRDIGIETNVFANSKDVRYTIVDKPQNGAIIRDKQETQQFNENDLIQQLVSYRHLGGSANTDKFRLKVSVRGAETEGIFTVQIYPQSYWEPLVVQSNNTVFVEEATSVQLSKKSLEVMHPKIPASQIVYHVREWPQGGYLELVQTTDELKDDYDGHSVRHFEQNLINEGRLYYVQSASNQTADKFVVDVTNGITWLHGLIVNFIIIPDKLYVEAHNLSVVEGKSVILRESSFQAVTSYFAGKISDYRIMEKPKHGLVIDSTKNVPIKKFTQKNLNAGVVLYRHGGDESAVDSFTMTVTAADKTSEPFQVWINVQSVNDEPPVLLRKNKMNIWQGSTVIMDNSTLNAADNDTTPDYIVYNVTNVRNGYFSFVKHLAIEIFNFTQKQLDESQIVFTHTNGSDAEFSFVLTDGVHATDTHTVPVTTKPIYLSIQNNNVLNVFPLTRKPITSSLLLTTCSDETRNIKYVVRDGPRLGKIIMETEDGTWLEVNQFTQRDINESRVTYEHTKQFMDLTTNDSFVFDIEAHYTTSIVNQAFRVQISVSSGGLNRYIPLNSVRVQEGGSANVIMNISGIIQFLRTKAGIAEPSVLSTLISQPSYGHVMLQPDLNITTFNQQQIESGKISYFHDNSDTLEDRIDFSLYLMPGRVLLCNASVGVTIIPVNDKEFKLVTDPPSMTVVQKQNQTITRDNLLTIDPDTSPDEIVYVLISQPNFGRLLLLPFDQNSSEVLQVNKFSQQDIDSSRLVYEHNGTLQADNFYFRVWDGKFNPYYSVLTILVLPIRLNVTVPNCVSLQQGSNVALISQDNVKLDTNARQDLVTYQVASTPKHGVLYVRDKAAVKFKQTDLLSKSVMYMQTDMTACNDSLELTAQLSGFQVKNINVQITVAPLMIINSITVLTGEKKQINLQCLDATPLAKLTSSNPVYTILRRPKFAKLKRIVRSTSSAGERRSTREKDITKFTHQEIISGMIYIVAKKVPTMEFEGVVDSFVFSLAASIFQPAIGEFSFRIRLDAHDFNNTLGGPMDPVGHEGEMAVAPNMSNDYLLVLGMLLGVFVIGLIVIVTIKCRHTRYKRAQVDDNKQDTTPAVGVIPLPRPPDHLMPTTPHLKRFTNDHSSLSSGTPLPPLGSMTSTLPQCKVIPLTPLDNITGSELDVSVRYPYGVADGDEWSTLETTNLPCQSATAQRTNPLLRRNQYWV